jgi:hypothetical protein
VKIAQALPRCQFPCRESFFGLPSNYREIYLEESFALMMHLRMSLSDIHNLPVRYRKWYMDRLVKHFTKNSEPKPVDKSQDAKNFAKFQDQIMKKLSD